MKPSIPKGTRDFGPLEMSRRNYIFSVIKKYFYLYGFEQIETPAMENLSTLMGKYGEEGDKLIFKILNSGDYLKTFVLSEQEVSKLKRLFESSSDSVNKWIPTEGTLDSIKHIKEISEKALRYDLTVPFARFVVQHQNEIQFPFKRFQIQPVWRGDSPQFGRYREFYQCDADVIGTTSLLSEIELLQMIIDVFSELGVNVKIKINNRKILSALGVLVGAEDRVIEIITAIDKYDKIGDKIYDELRDRNFSDIVVSRVKSFMDEALKVQKLYLEGKGKTALTELKTVFNNVPIGIKGIEEIEEIFSGLAKTYQSGTTDIILDLGLARGLNYYTGIIIEVKVDAEKHVIDFSSSILGGGRYDDLTGTFGLKGVSGVGISFGVDRIYDVMNKLNLFESEKLNTQKTKLLFANFGKAEELRCLELARTVRSKGISCEVYPAQTKKMQKQFEYAEKKGIQFMCFVGSEEMTSGIYPLKNIVSGEQEKLTIEEIIGKLGK